MTVNRSPACNLPTFRAAATTSSAIEKQLRIAILTTTPNSVLEDVHDRMPVILPRDCYERWLAPAEAKTHAELLLPFDGSLMKRYEVSPIVNSPRNDGPDCIAPLGSPINALPSERTLARPQSGLLDFPPA
jgi:putative SOS response-associated peptidase YedK